MSSDGQDCSSLTLKEVIALLRRACLVAGSQRQWALRHRLSSSYVSDVLSESREPGPAILRALGIERRVVVTYRRRDALACEGKIAVTPHAPDP